MHVYKTFAAGRYLARTASVKLRIGSPKTARDEQVVRTKGHTGSKFSKIFFEQLYTGWIVVVHLCFGFSRCRQMAPQHSAKFRTAFFGQFRTSLRKDSVANYEWNWTRFLSFARGRYMRCNTLNTHFRR